MVKIQVRKGESLESALRRFKEIYEKEGIADAIVKKAYYQKGGRKRKRRRGASRGVSANANLPRPFAFRNAEHK